MRKHVEQRRLSRTRGPHESNHLPGFDEATCRGEDRYGLLGLAVFDANRNIVPRQAPHSCVVEMISYRVTALEVFLCKKVWRGGCDRVLKLVCHVGSTWIGQESVGEVTKETRWETRQHQIFTTEVEIAKLQQYE